MNALLIYPEFPDTFWSFKHALKFLGKRAAQPPLGLLTVATRYRHCVGAAMTLAVMGYHFQVMTRRLSSNADSPVAPPAAINCLSAGSGRQIR